MTLTGTTTLSQSGTGSYGKVIEIEPEILLGGET